MSYFNHVFKLLFATFLFPAGSRSQPGMIFHKLFGKDKNAKTRIFYEVIFA